MPAGTRRNSEIGWYMFQEKKKKKERRLTRYNLGRNRAQPRFFRETAYDRYVWFIADVRSIRPRGWLAAVAPGIKYTRDSLPTERQGRILHAIEYLSGYRVNSINWWNIAVNFAPVLIRSLAWSSGFPG